MFGVFRSLFLLLSFMVFVSCGKDNTDNTIPENNVNENRANEENADEEPNVEVLSHIYGLKGKYDVASPWEESEHNMSVVYYPSNISKTSPTPVVFFAPGWESVNHRSYETLLKFIASHGYTVIYAKDDTGAYSANHLIKYFKQMMDNPEVKPYVDSTKIGVIGHSSGGGHAFKVLQEFSSYGWGSKGRFLLSLDPWFAFDMDKSDMRTLPSNTNVLLMQFGKGGENAGNSTDPRIPLSEYYLLSSIVMSKKDYQTLENATHSYPTGSGTYDEMKGLLRPLDALMEYSFETSKSVKAHQIALEEGSDDPYKNGNGIQNVKAISKYHYQCNGKGGGAFKTLESTDIDYCAMER